MGGFIVYCLVIFKITDNSILFNLLEIEVPLIILHLTEDPDRNQSRI